MRRVLVLLALGLMSCSDDGAAAPPPFREQTTTTTSPEQALETDLRGIIPSGSGDEFADLAQSVCDLDEELALTDVPADERSALLVAVYASLQDRGYSSEDVARILAVSMARFCPENFG